MLIKNKMINNNANYYLVAETFINNHNLYNKLM